MTGIDKSTYNQLREIVNIAYEREANNRLLDLSESFDDWRNELLGGGELFSLVQEFGQRQVKAIMDMYDSLEPELLIARAVVEGFLTEDEIRKVLSGRLKKAIEFYREKKTDR